MMKKGIVAGVLLFGVGAAVVLFLFDPARVPIYPVCHFRQWTSLDCPGCGSLRAMHALLHGNLAEAFFFNPLLMLSLPVFAWIGLRYAWSRRRGAQPFAVRPVWWWTFLGVWIAFGVLRNLPVQSLAAFAP